MSLESPTIFERGTGYVKAHRMVFIIIGLALVLLFTGLWMTDCGSNYFFWRGVNKLQANVNAALQDAANIKREEANLEIRKVEANANVNAAVKELQRETFGHEEAKRETNQALANYNKALATNANIDATKEDVLKALEKLNQ